MRSARKLLFIGATVGWLAFGTGNLTLFAAEKLANIGLEMSTGPANWLLTAEIQGMPGVFANATEHLNFANEPSPVTGELGLLTRPFAGNVGNFAGQDLALDLNLTQTRLVGANRTFTLTGHSLVQGSSSVIVDTLDALTPLGDYNLNAYVDAADYTVWRDTLGSTEDFRANGTNEGASLNVIDQADYEYWKARFGDVGRPAGVPSPTQSYIKVEFLDASNAVLATHSIDLRDDTTPEDPEDPQTDVWRTHTLADIVSPAGTTQARVSAGFTGGRASCSVCEAGSDLWLDNFSLNQTSAPFAGEKLLDGGLNTLGAPSGWTIEKTSEDNLSFAGNPSFAAHSGNVGMWLRSFSGGDAKLVQTLEATPGADYDFSAWSKWESGYNGADPFSFTQTFLTLEYLDGSSSVIDMHTLDLRTVQINDGEWRQFTLDGGTAPGSTAFVRVSVGASAMDNSGINPQSAFFDDFSLIETLPGAGALAAGAVPEPATLAMFGVAVLGLLGIRRRSN